MIDIVDALDLLDSCNREHGENYRPPPRLESAASPGAGGDIRRPVADSIVALAMARAGAPLTTSELGDLSPGAWRVAVLCAASSDQEAAPVLAALAAEGLDSATCLAETGEVLSLRAEA